MMPALAKSTTLDAARKIKAFVPISCGENALPLESRIKRNPKFGLVMFISASTRAADFYISEKKIKHRQRCKKAQDCVVDWL